MLRHGVVGVAFTTVVGIHQIEFKNMMVKLVK
jgi:hypothetical protein